MPLLRLPHAAAATILAVGAAQASDAITFVRLMLDHGSVAEANPLVASLVASGGMGFLLAAKVAVVALVVGVVVGCAPRHPVVSALVLTFAVGAGLFGATSNVLVLLHPYA